MLHIWGFSRKISKVFDIKVSTDIQGVRKNSRIYRGVDDSIMGYPQQRVKPMANFHSKQLDYMAVAVIELATPDTV